MALPDIKQFEGLSPTQGAAIIGRVTPEQAEQQARDIIESLKKEYGFDDEEARQHLIAQISEAAVAKGGDAQTVFDSYPENLKKLIVYTPEKLRVNQDVTKWGLILAPMLFTAGAGLVAFAAFRGLAAAAPWIARAIGLAGEAKNAQQVSNFLQIARQAAFPKVVVPGVLGTLAGALAWYTSSAVNNWNDVFHWGLSTQQSLAIELNKLANKQGAGSFGSGGTGQPGGGFAPSLTTTRTAKPKIFLGVVYAGRVADTPDFVRHVDDAITSDEDLKNDIQINLTAWLATMADRLNYEIQVKFEPYDLDNVRKPGYWMVMALYYSGKGGKRIFIDEILLGPFDNKAYYPTTQITDSIRKAIDAAVIPEILQPSLGSPSGLMITTREGDKFPLLPAAQASAPANALPESAPVSTPVPTPAPAAPTGAAAATTLYEFFSSEGRALPSASILGSIYQDAGFGSADSYRGTAEQNTQILALLKQKRGFPITAAPAAQPAAAAPAPTPVAPAAPVAPASAPTPSISPFQQFFPSLPSSPFAPTAPAPTAPTTRQMRSNTGSTTLNLRSAPDLQSSVVTSIPNGTTLVVGTDEISADGYHWVATVYNTRPGYVAREFLLPV